MKLKYNKGFTMVELLVVIAVIGFIITAALYMINVAKMKGRDARRLADMKQLQTALELYLYKYGEYPTSDGDGCGGWDVGDRDYPLLWNSALSKSKMEGILENPPKDPTARGNCSGYRYYRYPPTAFGSCIDIGKGNFYVLEIIDMETSNGKHPNSEGFKCSGRDWTNEGEWVAGKYEKN